jgi:hypothetical protein
LGIGKDAAIWPSTVVILYGMVCGRQAMGGARKDPIDVSRDRDLPYGMYIVYTVDGETQIDSKEMPEDELERILTAILKLTVGSTAEAVKSAIGSVSKK